MLTRKIITSNTYYFWLCDCVNVGERKNRYALLLKALHSKSFRWLIPNDDNREIEGKNLRERFCDEEDIDFEYDDSEASMFEVILGLAFRCYDIMDETDENLSIGEWFWMMLSNCGLDKFTDENWYHYGGPMVVDQILDRIINRTYDRRGNGGLFPIKRVRKDQRKVELWYQMNQYLVENFYVRDLFW